MRARDLIQNACGLTISALFALAVCSSPSPAAAASSAPTSRSSRPPATAPAPIDITSPDVAAARALFQANLDAIRRRDRDAYIACYLESDSLARTGPSGFSLGYKDLVQQTSSGGWPDRFEAMDLHLVPVRAGLVYGTYRYRVRYGDDEQSGLSERLFLSTDRGWRIAVTTAFAAVPGVPPPPVALVGATLVDGTGKRPVKDAVIVLRNGKIECAGSRSKCRVPAGVDTVNLAGMWITPGLIDAHVHYSQTGWLDGRPDAIDLRDKYPYEQTEERLRAHPEVWHRSYLASGVTAVFDVGGYPWTVALQGAAERDTRAPHYAAAGPLLSTLDFWLNLPAERQFIYLKDDSTARAGVRYLKSLGSAAVKVWFILTPGRDFGEMARVVMAAGDEARRLGLPLIVHATGLKEAKAALKAGAKLLVHSVWDQPIDGEFIALMRKHHAIYCPTLTVIDGYARAYAAASTGEAVIIDDPTGAVDSLTYSHVASTPSVARGRVPRARAGGDSMSAAMHRIMDANLGRLDRAGIPIAMGTDAGNPLTLHGPAVFAEMEAMQGAGLSPAAVLVAATRGGAQAMGRLSDFGTVEVGKAADLVIVDADPTADVANLRRIRYVVRGGVLRSIEELRVRRR